MEGQTQIVSDHVFRVSSLEFRIFTTKAQRHQDLLFSFLFSLTYEQPAFNLQPVTRAERVPQDLRTEGPEPRAERA